MSYILLLLLISSNEPEAKEMARFKSQADCNEAAAKASYTPRQGAQAAVGFLCVAAGNEGEDKD